jgi:catechol 2,3-dioxygenase-like lactoylglutathione lyase family enzyme
MTMKIHHITIDAHQPDEISRFWATALGWAEDPDDPNLPEHDEAAILSPDRSEVLLFERVPEGKTVKNRIHLDLMPTDRTRDEAVEQLLGLGATFYADFREPDGSGWVVLQDPDGNEFCVERSQAERDAQPAKSPVTG